MTPVYLPAEERVEIIREYARRYNIKHFIETGTSEGATTWALRNEFDSIVTIELDLTLHERARQMFAAWDNITCLWGDSGNVLPQLRENWTDPLLFWLDGHYCGGGSARGEIDTPVIAELMAATLAPIGSVILVDDARLFGGMSEHTEEFKDYPTVNWIKEVARVTGHEFELADDIMRLVHTSHYIEQ